MKENKFKDLFGLFLFIYFFFNIWPCGIWNFVALDWGYRPFFLWTRL